MHLTAKLWKLRLFVCIMILFFSSISSAEIRDLTAQELKAMLDGGQKVFLLNPLSDIEFNEGHIPGSVNIPLEEIIRSKLLPKDKDVLIISYCLSPK